MTKKEKVMVRELIMTVEYLHSVCELTDGKLKADRYALFVGMRVGIAVLQNYKHLIPDYQRQSYWDDVWAFGERFHPKDRSKVTNKRR